MDAPPLACPETLPRLARPGGREPVGIMVGGGGERRGGQGDDVDGRVVFG